MSIKGKAYIAGVFEHPTRKADSQSLAQLHAESAKGALEDAGLTRADVDGYFCAGDAPGLGGLSMADYMGLKLRHIDTTETGRWLSACVPSHSRWLAIRCNSARIIRVYLARGGASTPRSFSTAPPALVPAQPS